jgi:polysaccharide biosynthesis protein PelC
MMVILIALGLFGCGMGPTVFLNRDYNYQYLERVAIIPFDNLTDNQMAGARATRVFLSQLLASESFDVVEPGEVSRAVDKFTAGGRNSELTQEQILNIGKELKVQGIFVGSITELTELRSGSSSTNIVTIVARLIETEKGTTIWSGTNSSGKKGFWASLFGGGGKTQTEAIRDCVDGLIKTLIK